MTCLGYQILQTHKHTKQNLKLAVASTNLEYHLPFALPPQQLSLLARTTKQNRTDVYLFFAGHGLANQSGEDMYILPYDGSPRVLEDSAISRKELFNDIASANPRSVNVFLDTCYSGTTRGPDMLIASGPIVIKARNRLYLITLRYLLQQQETRPLIHYKRQSMVCSPTSL